MRIRIKNLKNLLARLAVILVLLAMLIGISALRAWNWEGTTCQGADICTAFF